VSYSSFHRSIESLGSACYGIRNDSALNHPILFFGSIFFSIQHLFENMFDRKLFPLTPALTLTLTLQHNNVFELTK